MLDKFWIEPIKIEDGTVYYEKEDNEGFKIQLSFSTMTQNIRTVITSQGKELAFNYIEKLKNLKVWGSSKGNFIY